MRRRVVVTGIGILSPLGTNLQQSWCNLISGKSGITKLCDADYQTLPCQVAGLIKDDEGNRFDLTKHFSKSELKSMAPATAYALLATDEALKQSRLQFDDEETKTRIGVAVGMGMIDLDDVCTTYELSKKSFKQVSPFFVPRILPNMAAGQISIRYGFRGPNHAVSTACATGAHAIGDSFRFVQRGDADVMVCGGTEACVSPLAIAAFCRLRALSTQFNATPEKASRPFDKRRDGFVMGEGSAILILEELQHAIDRKADIHAEILGYGLSGDASHLTAPRPDGTGALLAMRRAISDAQLVPEDVTYVNAHATSTPMGDSIETTAIKTLYAGNVDNMAVSSTKGAHGHLLGAAGNLEAAFTVMALKESILPPTINLDEPEDVNVNFVPNKYQKWTCNKRRIALKNAFGFGGTNACLCLGEYR